MDDIEVEYDVSGWSSDRLGRLFGSIAQSGVPFEFEPGRIVVPKFYESLVDLLVGAVDDMAPSHDRAAFGAAPPPPPPPPPHFATGRPSSVSVGPTAAYSAPPTGYGGPVLPSSKVSGLAVASLVLGIFWVCGLGSILAAVFGIVSIRQINQSDGRLRGKGLAIAGLVLGILGVLFVAASLIWGEDPTTPSPR